MRVIINISMSPDFGSPISGFMHPCEWEFTGSEQELCEILSAHLAKIGTMPGFNPPPLFKL